MSMAHNDNVRLVKKVSSGLVVMTLTVVES